MRSNTLKKAFYVSVSDLEIFLDVAERLRDEHGIEPVYWSAAKSQEDQVRERFPSIFFYHTFDAIFGLSPEGLSIQDGYKHLGEGVLEEYSDVQAVLFELMITRADTGGGFSYYEASHYYHQYLAIGMGLVEKLLPDMWISASAPHMMYDYVLYNIFSKRDIPVAILNPTVVPGRVYTIGDMKDSTDMIREEYDRMILKNKRPSTLPQEITEYMTRLQGNYEEAMPLNTKLYYQKKKQSGRTKECVGRRLKTARRLTRKLKRSAKLQEMLGNSKPAPPHYYKQENKRWEDSYNTQVDYHAVREKLLDTRIRLFNEYSSRAKTPDINKKYIYVPFHQQPENTTVPEGGRLSDQLLMLKLLDSVVPEGIRLYVKENPFQFEWHRGSFARPQWYYSEIDRLGSVDLMQIDVDSFTLIDNCLCILTLTGTSGFEGLVRGKPVLLGGDVIWYKDAPGVYPVKSAGDMNHALKKIVKDGSVDRDELERFMSAFANATFNCTTKSEHLKCLPIDPQDNQEELVRAILQRVE